MTTKWTPFQNSVITVKLFVPVWLAVSLVACGGDGNSAASNPAPNITVTVSGLFTPLSTGASRTFTAVVSNTSNSAVSWSVVETGGGTITQSGIYTAPKVPGTYTVRAAAQANPTISGAALVPVIIPEGHINGYDVGVDYHAYGSDFLHTAFITIYKPGKRAPDRSHATAGNGRSRCDCHIHANVVCYRARHNQLW